MGTTMQETPPSYLFDGPALGDEPKALVAVTPAAMTMASLPGETASTAAAVQAKTQVEARYQMAMHNPRSMMTVRAKLLDACKRPRFAGTARYAKPVGKSKIVGWSIRFAEECARCLGNLLVETAVLYDSQAIRILRVMVTDLESNLTYPSDVTVHKTVERSNADGKTVISSRMNSYNKPVYTVEATEDDLLNKQNALVSKAMRTAILRIVPGDILEDAEEMVLATLQNEDARDPAAKAKYMADAFYALGVMPAQLEKVLGHPLAQCTPSEVTLLRTWFTALKEGEATWKEIEAEFGAKAEGNADGIEATKSDALRDRLKARTEKAKSTDATTDGAS